MESDDKVNMVTFAYNFLWCKLWSIFSLAHPRPKEKLK